jgi:uncharacterized protein YneF (UPF0154 family)
VSRFVKLLLVLAFAAGVWVGVKLMMEQKQRFLALSEDEQRAFLADKIGSKVPEEKLVEIQDAVISAVNSKKG